MFDALFLASSNGSLKTETTTGHGFKPWPAILFASRFAVRNKKLSVQRA
jgi:hypothetical protein